MLRLTLYCQRHRRDADAGYATLMPPRCR